MNIDGSIALVTGANRGLGRVFVEQLVERGAAKIYAGARTPFDPESLKEQLGEQVTPIALDVTRDSDVQNAASLAADATLVINNAGILKRTGLIEAGSLVALETELNVNTLGVARMALAFAPVLKQNGGGAFLNVLSAASLHGFAPFGTYSATKAAAMSLTQSLRYELRDQGTTVHGVYAGYIATDMTAGIQSDMASAEDIVTASLDGLDKGIRDIDADDRAAAVRQLLREADFETIQDAYFNRADDYYATQGRGKS